MSRPVTPGCILTGVGCGIAAYTFFVLFYFGFDPFPREIPRVLLVPRPAIIAALLCSSAMGVVWGCSVGGWTSRRMGIATGVVIAAATYAVFTLLPYR